MKWPDVLLYPASPTQAGCECAMGFLAAASGGAPPMLAEPRQHAPVLQHTPHPRRTPTNVFSKALAFEARLCESAPVSRVPRKRRRHRQNAERVSAGLNGTLPEGGSVVGRRFLAKDRVQCRLLARCCQDNTAALSQVLLPTARSQGGPLGRYRSRPCFPNYAESKTVDVELADRCFDKSAA